AEARKFLEPWGWRIAQLGYAARRRTCDWNYTLPEEKERAIEILLPDAQEMRQWSRLLALKARVEIAERDFAAAARTIETGLAFSRHLAEGPFLINALIGIASAQTFLDRLDEFVAQPGAPNLYWSLAALPGPLVGIRKAIESEQRLVEY